MIAKLKYVCARCESENVTRNADAVWSTAEQKWELSALYDDAHCNACGNATWLLGLPLEMPNTHPRGTT
jgi:DNA-directed RNA polymerase subunit RPC12/RpoP